MKKLSILLLMVFCLCIASASSASAEEAEMILPESLVRIEKEAFLHSRQVTRVSMHNGVTSIGSRAFEGTELTWIFLPPSIREIADDALSGREEYVTARVHEGSYAYYWCLKKGIKIELITAEEIQTDVTDMVFSAVEDYEDEEGCILPETERIAVQEVKEALRQAKKEGKIIDFSSDGNSVIYIDAPEGELWFWTPLKKGMLSGGVTESSILTFNGFDFASGDWGKRITETFDHFTSNDFIERVTPANLEKMGPDQVVFLSTHGGIYENHLFLATEMTWKEGKAAGDKYNTKVLAASDPKNWTDRLDLVHWLAGENKEAGQRICVTPYFFEHHCPDLKGSMIWLGCCHSAQTNELAEILLRNGACAVVGYDNAAASGYNNDLLKTTLDRMCEIDDETGFYTTLGKAVSAAKAEHGKEDWTLPDSVGAQAVIKGGTKAEKYRLYNSGLLKGSVLGKKVGSSALIPVPGASLHIINELADETKSADPAGRFSCLLPEGIYTIYVSADEYGDVVCRDVKITADDTTEIVIEYQERRIEGKVISSFDGTPLKGAEIKLTNGMTYHACTDENGCFALSVYQNKGTLTAGIDSYTEASCELDLQPGEVKEMTIELDPLPAYITGSVSDASTGSPVDDAIFVIRDVDGKEIAPITADTGKSGTLFRIGMYPGKYILSAGKEGYESVQTEVTLKPGETLSRSFRLQPEQFTVTFMVEDKVYETQTVKTGEPAVQPADPHLEGGIFQGWGIDEENLWDFDTPVTRDVVLYSLWSLDTARLIAGRIFQPLTNRVVGDAVVELHRGYKDYSYTAENIYKVVISGTNETDYEETAAASTVSDSEGGFALFIPEEDTSVNGGRSTYTLVVKKEGWMTSYWPVYGSYLSEEGYTGFAIPFAPEGSELRITGDHSVYGSEQTILTQPPYTASGYITVQGWYDDPCFMYSAIYAYYNDELVYQWNAPYYSKGDYWHVLRIFNGKLYSINTRTSQRNYSYPVNSEERDALMNRQLVYPRWLKY